MLNGTAIPIGARRGGRLLWLGVVTVVFVTALAGPAISAPPSAAGSDVAGDQAGQSSRWTARPPLRHARGGLGVAEVGRHILAIGGFDDATVFDVVEARRVKGRGTWRELAPLPTARANLATAEVGGLVYAVGVSMTSMSPTSWRRSTRGRGAGRPVSRFPNHAPRPERRAWVGCCMWPVARSSWLLTPTRSPTR